ncbi:MAG: hypothetical protein methR_P3872 [Methyloprofundus sp.]|nr:MAG: hypothetical protein methR_P3872 [Methyloprofundus sp.]
MQSELPLRDVQIPAAISWWPPAIGWWVLAILIPLSLYLLFRLYRRLTRKTALKAAKKYFKVLQQDTELSELEKLQALSKLMRRTAISLYPRNDVAGLVGNQWLNFLDNSMPTPQFSSDTGRLLTDSLYRSPTKLEALTPLFALCATWLAQQKEPKT